MPHSADVHAFPLRVRYAETDAAGLAHHGSYLPWFEAARVEWLRAHGIVYAELEREGYHLAVVEAFIRYVAPARFDDALLVRTGLVDMRSREATFVYEVVTDTAHPRQLANGRTRHICLFRGQVAKLPEAVRRLAGA
ncbi:MAG: acyl-CoA thioesterase [Ardenticatenales bacterium]|nr:acyl-CoA thioesterase [Ardenticatenales bacterium]